MKFGVVVLSGTIGVIAVIIIAYYVSTLPPAEAVLQIVGLQSTWSGESSDRQLVITGRAVNSGNIASKPAVITIELKDNYGRILHTGTTSPEPSIVQPGQEAPFTFSVNQYDVQGYDAQGYTGPITYIAYFQSY